MGLPEGADIAKGSYVAMARRFKSELPFVVRDDKMVFAPQAVPFHGCCPGGKFHYINTVPEALEVLGRRQKLPIAIDIETSGLDPFSDDIYLISIAFTNLEAFVLDWRQLSYEDPELWVDVSWFLIENKFVIHNSLFEQMFFRQKFGTFATLIGDTQVMNEVTTAGLPDRSSLEAITKFYLDVDMEKGWGKGFADVAPFSPFPEEAIQYAAGDVTRLLQLYYLISQRLKSDKLWHIWEEVELPFLSVVAEAKYRGIRIDVSVLEALQGELKEELDKYAGAFALRYPELNINSSQQITELLVNLGNRVENSDEECLSKIIDRGSKPSQFVASTVLGYRGVKKLLSTYVDPLQGKHLNPKTGRLHPNWRPCGTDTGRMACRDPNVQNIPLNGPGGKIRDAFVADPGCLLITADYSQFELRVLASLSKEPLMVNAFRNGIDLHSQTAELLFGPEFTKEDRKTAKTFNFAIAYGAGPPALAQQCGVSIQVAQQLYDKFFKSYPILAGYLRRSSQYAKDYGESSSPFGRKRYYTRPSIEDEGYRWRMEAIGRAGVNHPIQSCNGDSIKLASLGIDRRIKRLGINASILMWIHDEIVVQCEEEHAELLAGIVEQEMVEAAVRFVTEVPVEVSLSISDRWSK